MVRPGAKVLCLVVAMGCGSSDTTSPSEQTPPPAPPPPAINDAAAASAVTMPPHSDVPDKWWTQPSPCPTGMTLRGKPPPDGQSVWCANDDYVRTGPNTTFHESGEKSSEGWEHENHRVGPWTFWYPNGAVRLQATFLPHNGQTGAYAHWKPTGELIGEYTLVDGTGTATWWRDDGSVLSSGPMKAGQREGAWTDFHRSGAKSDVIEYRRGLRHGASTTWDDQGRVVLEGTYADGKRVGTWTTYDPATGKPLREAQRADDREIAVSYFQDGVRLGPKPAPAGRCATKAGVVQVVSELGGEAMDDDDSCVSWPKSFPGVVLLGSFAHDRGCMRTGAVLDCKTYVKDWPDAASVLARAGWADANADSRVAIAERYIEEVATEYGGSTARDPARPKYTARGGGVVADVWVDRPSGMRRGRVTDLYRYTFTKAGTVNAKRVRTVESGR